MNALPPYTPAADPRELPMRIVGKRVKTSWDRYAEIVRHARYFRRTRPARIEIVQPDGTCLPYVRGGTHRTA